MRFIGVALALLTVCATIASAQTFFFGDDYIPDYKLMPADVACWLYKNKSIGKSGFDAWTPILAEVIVDAFGTDMSIVNAIIEHVSNDIEKSDSARDYVLKTLRDAVSDMKVVVLVEGEDGPEIVKEKASKDTLEHITSARCAMNEREHRPEEVEAVVPEETADAAENVEDGVPEIAEDAETVEDAVPETVELNEEPIVVVESVEKTEE